MGSVRALLCVCVCLQNGQINAKYRQINHIQLSSQCSVQHKQSKQFPTFIEAINIENDTITDYKKAHDDHPPTHTHKHTHIQTATRARRMPGRGDRGGAPTNHVHQTHIHCQTNKHKKQYIHHSVGRLEPFPCPARSRSRSRNGTRAALPGAALGSRFQFDRSTHRQSANYWIITISTIFYIHNDVIIVNMSRILLTHTHTHTYDPSRLPENKNKRNKQDHFLHVRRITDNSLPYLKRELYKSHVSFKTTRKHTHIMYIREYAREVFSTPNGHDRMISIQLP